MAWGGTFLEFEKFLSTFFPFACFSRYSIAPMVKIDETMVGAKFRSMLKDHVLPFAKDT